MSDNFERRPNPPGWTPPKAPYNPYDPTDLRPAEGYPSEFNMPGKPRNWSIIPKEPSNYRVVRETMKKLHYTPRPLSELYPGQYKLLRRTDHTKFKAGVRLTSMFMTTVLIVGGVFFYRWNDGYDNIFSGPYRFQLRLRDRLFGNLTERQKEDLKPKQRGMVRTTADSSSAVAASQYTSPQNENIAMERPNRGHMIEAERIRQEREEAILRAVDIAEAQLKNRK